MVWLFHSFADVPAILLGCGPVLAQTYWCGKPQFSPEQVPDQSGRTIIVTGGNSGIGKETAKALLQRNANVYLACRNPSAAQDAIYELKELTGKEAKFLHLDLGDLASVQTAAEDFLMKEKHLHVLYNNAGIMFCPMEMEINGYDAQIHTNVLGPFLFTKLLLPVLLATAQADGAFTPRVINVSSCAHYVVGAQPLDLDTFKCTAARSTRTTEEMYAQSKFANIVFSNELARRYEGKGIISISLNPGTVQTNLSRYIHNMFSWVLTAALQIYPASYGALTQLWAGTMPGAAQLNGQFMIPWARVGVPRVETLDPLIGRDLWEWLDEQVKDFES